MLFVTNIWGALHFASTIYAEYAMKKLDFRTSIKGVANAMGIKSVQIKKSENLDMCADLINNLQEPSVIELITYGTEVPIAADRFKALKGTK